MNWLKLTWTPTSSLMKLPTAETIFGALSWAYRDLYGEVALEHWLQTFNDERPLVLSDLFPKGYVPFPQQLLARIAMTMSDDKRATIEKYTPFLECRYMDIELFIDYLTQEKATGVLANGEPCGQFLVKRGQQPPQWAMVHDWRNAIDRRSGTTVGEGGQLFEQPRLYVGEGATFEMYVQANDWTKYAPLFRYIEDCGVGKRRNVGFQHFRIEAQEIQPLRSQSVRHCWSSFVPNEQEVTTIDWAKSFYQLVRGSIFSDERYDTNIRKDTIVQLVETGATMAVSTPNSAIGQLIQMERSNVRNYAIGFLI